MSDRLTIRSDGRPHGTRVYLDGNDVTSGVTSVEWRHNAPGMLPVATVEFQLVEVETAAGEAVWLGLDRVPTALLAEELDRRAEEDDRG